MITKDMLHMPQFVLEFALLTVFHSPDFQLQARVCVAFFGTQGLLKIIRLPCNMLNAQASLL